MSCYNYSNQNIVLFRAEKEDSNAIDRLLSTYFLDRDEVPYTNFIIAKNLNGEVLGAASYRGCEVHTIVVHPSHKNKGIGRSLLSETIKTILHSNKADFIYTKTTVPGFFIKCGFTETTDPNVKAELWSVCGTCDKAQICSQKVLILKINEH